jgi:hypothetical protein
MTDWVTWSLVGAAALVGLVWWLWRVDDDPDVIERFKHWRP